jgi:hypothetical protein
VLVHAVDLDLVDDFLAGDDAPGGQLLLGHRPRTAGEHARARRRDPHEPGLQGAEDLGGGEHGQDRAR